MQKKQLVISLLAAVLLTPSVTRAADRFELLSRSLLQQHTTSAAFFDRGLIISAGGALAIASPADSLQNYTLVPLNGEPQDLVINGNFAYIAAKGSGLITVDLSDPENPACFDSYRTIQPLACRISLDHLFLTDVKKGLLVFGLANPARPEFIENIGIDKGVISMAAADNTLILFYTERAILFGVSDDCTVKLLTEIETVGGTGRGLVHDSILYAIHRDGKVSRYDISDPSAAVTRVEDLPVKNVSSIDINGKRGMALTTSGRLVPFSLSGTHVTPGKPVKADFSGAINIPPGVKFSLSGRMTGKRISDTVPGKSLILSSDRVVTLDPQGGPCLFGIEEKNLRFIANIPTSGYAIDLVARDDWLYLANGRGGLRTGKVDENGQIEWKGHLQTTVARDVALSGDILLLADGNDGMKTIDISDPANPVEIGHLPSPFFLSAIVTRGTLAFLAGGLGGAEVVDFRNPRKPKLLWREKFSEVRGIFADSRFFYLSDGFEGFHIYRMEGNEAVWVSTVNTGGWNDDIFVTGDTIYLAEGGKGLDIADISDRKNPRILGSVDIGSIAREIHVIGRTVFVASHMKGITAVDASDPAKPFISAVYPSVDDARGVYADNRFVYLASGAGGVYIFRYIER